MPLTYQDFSLLSARAVVHTPGGQVAAPRLLVALLSRWADLFDGEPLSFPTTMGGVMEAPPEVPRFLLTSASHEFQLQVAGNAAMFVWERQDAGPEYDLTPFIERAHQVLTHFLEEAPARAGRISLNVRRRADDSDPAAFLIHHFCQQRWIEGALKRQEDFTLNAHKVYQMTDEFRVNSWVRCRAQRPNIDDEDEDEGEDNQEAGVQTPAPFILLEHDMSTLAEVAAEVQFSSDQILHFLTTATVEVDHIAEMYFPKD